MNNNEERFIDVIKDSMLTQWRLGVLDGVEASRKAVEAFADELKAAGNAHEDVAEALQKVIDILSESPEFPE